MTMLKDMLTAINKSGYLSRSKLAQELRVPEAVIDQGIANLIQMGYLIKEETGESCPTTCGSCPFAKTCGKEILTIYRMSDKGKAVVG